MVDIDSQVILVVEKAWSEDIFTQIELFWPRSQLDCLFQPSCGCLSDCCSCCIHHVTAGDVSVSI